MPRILLLIFAVMLAGFSRMPSLPPMPKLPSLPSIPDTPPPEPIPLDKTTGPMAPQALAGDWSTNDGNSASKACRVSLEIAKDPSGYHAFAYGCMGPDLRKVAGWRVRGTAIALTDVNGATLVILKREDGKHFSGLGASGDRITITR